ncbi:MAG: ABC transporter permease, partial [Planktomarina sp.]
SGKMFVANTLPSFMLNMFDWNPLFHCIDQARGFIFINYNPHHSSITYPLIVGSILIVIGLMGEFYTRKHASESWSARR